MAKKRKASKKKHPALNPQANHRIRREFIDLDYVDKLSEKDKEWLNKFMDEYNGANLDFKNLKKNLHKTKRLKKDCTDRVNARNRDIYARSKATGNLYYANSQDYLLNSESSNPEDALIDMIDDKKKEEI